MSTEDEKLRKLERENRELREENEILKKAAAYFANAVTHMAQAGELGSC
ncbi:MAG: hypothetical protein GX434_02015 [Peptococcaceae bacterium]|nr:hypothetical protein [Peptococcaceae bacterium]